MATIAENLQIIKDSITAIKQSIISKGGNVSGDISTWANAINNIPSGGDGDIPSGGGSAPTPVAKGNINFLDYDGAILHSYTKEQFLALSAMPELPTRNGLICQGWNWDLNDAKSYVRDYGMLNIGTMYITDDGDTRLYIRIATEGRMTVPLYWSQTVSSGVSINWGDGSDIQSVSGTGNINTTHTYAKPGDYVIRLKVVNNCTLELGRYSSSYCVMGATGSKGNVYCNMLQKVEIGTNVTSIGTYAFYHCYSLASVTIPSSVTSIGTYEFRYCYSLTSVTIPSNVTSIGNHAFWHCYSLTSVSIPSSVTSIDFNAFGNCYSLASVTIPSSVTSIGIGAFSGCYSLASVTIPSSVTSISNTMFSSCYGMAIYDFTKHTSVPSLANTNAFNGIPSDCIIKVPSSLLSAWKSATNWSTYASKIVAG